MFLYTDTELLQSHLRPLTVLIFILLSTHTCRGQSQLIGPSQPVIATLGKDVILPCHLEPKEDASDLTLEWTRPDLDPRFVLVWRTGQELEAKKHKSFKGRTSLFVDELNVGNISLKLSTVRLSDQGRYRCFIPTPDRQAFVQLDVVSDAATSPVIITLDGVDKGTSGVILDCESKGWYPEPEVSWLDSEGHVLSAGPTETVRGPDGLYTVSSRVTVEKRHRNNFTCRVQQKNINQTRETQIRISDHFFQVQSSSYAATVGLAVSLSVCILIILILVFLVWSLNRNKTKRGHKDETVKGEKKNCFKSKKTKDQSVPGEEREREPLRTDETGQMKVLNKDEGQKKKKHPDENKCEVSVTDDTSSVSQSSTTGPVVRVDRGCKFIRLVNSSKEDQQLGGWKVQIKINNTKPITHTFDDSFKLSPGKDVTLWSYDHGSDNPPTDLRLKDLKSWSATDQLQVRLISNTGETKSTQSIGHN